MKILKYSIKPMKYVMFLCLITALIYYRSLIFHSNVNQYIDIADLMLEEKYDIVIPQHFSSDLGRGSEQNVVENKIEEKSIHREEPVKSDFDNDIKVLEGKEVSVVNKQEKVAVIDEESSTKSSSIDASSNDTATVEVDLAEIIRQVENKEELMEELSETVDIINKKVDMLFALKNMNTTEDVVKQKQVTADAIENNEVVEPLVSKVSVADVIAETEKVSKDASTVVTKEDQLNKQIINKDVVSSVASLPDSRDMLFKARQTFWNGKPDVSEKLYLDLAVRADDDPDIYGELGNVYYSQGKWKRAGEAYYEAAVRLLALKQSHQVNYLLMIIQGLDTESADKLRHKISG